MINPGAAFKRRAGLAGRFCVLLWPAHCLAAPATAQVAVPLLAGVVGLGLGLVLAALWRRRGMGQVTVLPDALPGLAFRCVFEPKPRLLAINRGVSRLLGIEPAALWRMSAEDLLALVHYDDRPALEELGEALRSGALSSGSVQFRFRSPGGRQRLLLNQFAAEPRRSATAPATFLGILSDVTLSREEAEARELSELRLRSLSKLLDIEFFELDPRSGSWRLEGSLFASLGHSVGNTPRYSNFIGAVHRDDRALLPATAAGFLTWEGVSEVAFRFIDGSRR